MPSLHPRGFSANLHGAAQQRGCPTEPADTTTGGAGPASAATSPLASPTGTACTPGHWGLLQARGALPVLVLRVPGVGGEGERAPEDSIADAGSACACARCSAMSSRSDAASPAGPAPVRSRPCTEPGELAGDGVRGFASPKRCCRDAQLEIRVDGIESPFRAPGVQNPGMEARSPFLARRRSTAASAISGQSKPSSSTVSCSCFTKTMVVMPATMAMDLRRKRSMCTW
mmetsp:Transcript_28586/g.82201  ORF Transcript_28586/g.82201 Transcript_28586/m.82201 type:complete len:229 (-) Transcript_28586:276-962(-)